MLEINAQMTKIERLWYKSASKHSEANFEKVLKRKKDSRIVLFSKTNQSKIISFDITYDISMSK